MWCPKCKIEYREGITVCADCGTELVEKIENLVDLCEIKDEASADEMMEFLQYSGIKDVRKEWSDTSESFRLMVEQKLAQKAEKLVHGYLLGKEEEKENGMGSMGSEETNEPETEDNIGDRVLFDEEVEEDTVELLYNKERKEFVKKSDKYKDVKFSGYTLILFGVIGGVYLALTQFKVIPLSYDFIVLCLLAVLFAGFLVAGIVSLVKASKIKKEIPEEEERMAAVNQWMEEQITEEQMARWRDASVSDMENDLLVTARLRKVVSGQFPEMDENMIEKLVDEYYENTYA